MGRKKKFKIKYPRARVHHLSIFQYDKNGDLFITAEKIKECIEAHAGGYETYSFILHDSDVYNGDDCCEYAEKNKIVFIQRLQVLSDAKGLPKDETTESGFVYDEELEEKAHEYADSIFPPILPGTPKKPHFHVVLTFTQARALDEVARWFKGRNNIALDPNWNEAKNGHGAAENAWLYLVHARDKKKFQYNKEDVVASFDYIEELEKNIKKHEDHEKYNISKGDFNDVVALVMHGMSKKEAMAMVSDAEYMKNESVFERARKWYILNEAPMPFHREVFYVDSEGIDDDHGKGGLGKSACAKAFAKQLAAEFGADMSKNINDLQEYVFIAGDKDVFLQDYDGQPVLLVDEINGVDFKVACRGVNGVKALLAPFPERKSFNKKHGSVICTAKYIVINGIESFEKFKTSLAQSATIGGVKQESEESVKEQFDRRFWGNIHIVNASEVEFWINRGLFDKVPQEKQLMEMIARRNVSFSAIASSTVGEAQAYLEEKALRPLLDEVDKANINHASDNKVSNIDSIPPELLCMGEIVECVEDEEENCVIESDNAFDVFSVINRMVDDGLISIESMEESEKIMHLVKHAIDYVFYSKTFEDIVNMKDRLFVSAAIMTVKEMRGA